MRWKNLEAENLEPTLPGLEPRPSVRSYTAPESTEVTLHEVHARSALNSVPPMSAVDFRWTVNPYRGCVHACSYCFARPTHRYLDLDPRGDFERQIVVKVNLPDVLRSELRKPSWAGELVALGTNTDPYQWVEGRYRLTRRVFEVLAEARNPCSVLTKSPLLLRDIDVFEDLCARTEFRANLSIPTLDERAWRQTEPHTPHPRKRIEAVAKLRERGIPCGVLIAPLMPGINDSPEQVARIVELCEEAGASSIGGLGLHLRGELRAIFFDWLDEHRPELRERYERLYPARGRGVLAPAERRRLAALTGPTRRA